MIAWHQLRTCGVTRSTALRWRDAGRLHRRHRGVYALGHASVPIEGRMVAALLHAGNGAALSHRSAAWWWRLIDEEPATIDVSTPTSVRSVPGVVVHHPRQLDVTRERRVLVTTVARTLLDLAATVPFAELRHALANADYRQLLGPGALTAVLRRGRPGSAALRRAIALHEPRLALTRSKLERDLIALCESHGIELPQINVRVAGWLVDACWPEQRLIVEVDGVSNHTTPAQIARDRRKDLALRAAGFLVVRYSYNQVNNEPERVAAELTALLSSTGRSAVRGSR